MILHVLSTYRSASASYEAGDVIEVSEALGQHLLIDAPGCFAIEAPADEAKAPTEAPADKMIKAPARRK